MKNLLQASNVKATLFQLTLPLAVYLAWQADAGLLWWAASAVMFAFVYVIIGNNIGFHRYFAHSQFTVGKPVEWLFAWAGSMIGFGDPISYSMTHLVHHKYPDSTLDPHGPARGLKSVLIMFQKTVNPAETPLFSRRIVQLNRQFEWLYRYYIPFILVNVLLLWLIDYKIMLFLWWLPACLANWYIAWAVVRQHWAMKPHNSKWNRWEFTHESLHLNHHLWAGAPNNAINPGEIDYTYQFSKLFRPIYDWRGQPK
jgi:fatty-acid desaturase